MTDPAGFEKKVDFLRKINHFSKGVQTVRAARGRVGCVNMLMLIRNPAQLPHWYVDTAGDDSSVSMTLGCTWTWRMQQSAHSRHVQ